MMGASASMADLAQEEAQRAQPSEAAATSPEEPSHELHPCAASSFTYPNTSGVDSTLNVNMMRRLNAELMSHLASADVETDWTSILEGCMQKAADIQAISLPKSNFTVLDAGAKEDVPFRFLDLPIELRHIIYRMVITPKIARDHVEGHKIPTLFRISHEMSYDFAAFYYSSEVFQVELFEPSRMIWEQVQDKLIIRAMFEELGVCSVDIKGFSLEGQKRMVQSIGRVKSYSKAAPVRAALHTGVLTCVGQSDDRAFVCNFKPDAKSDVHRDRLRTLARYDRSSKWLKRLEEAALCPTSLYSTITFISDPGSAEPVPSDRSFAAPYALNLSLTNQQSDEHTSVQSQDGLAALSQPSQLTPSEKQLPVSPAESVLSNYQVQASGTVKDDATDQKMKQECQPRTTTNPADASPDAPATADNGHQSFRSQLNRALQLHSEGRSFEACGILSKVGINMLKNSHQVPNHEEYR